jgi:hypothetical protein
VTIFEHNEKLKEDLVMNFGAWEAKSIIFKEGVLIIPEPFLETIVRWDKDTESKLITKGVKKILEFKKSMEERCYVSDIQYETVYGHPQVIWAIFKEKENIFP